MAFQKYQKTIIKLLFFLAYASGAVWLSYFYVYLKDGAGLTGIEIGIIAGFQQFNNIFVLPVWGMLADKYGRKRMLLYSIGLTMLLLPFFVILKGALLFILFMFVLTLVYNPLASLIDTIGLDYEAQSEGKTSYGEIRLWASVGWGLSSFLTGTFIHEGNLYLIFPVASLLFLLTWIILFTMYKPLKVKVNLNKMQRGIIWYTLRNERVLFLFLLLVFFYSIFSAPIYLMINVYFLDIGAANQLIGLAFLVQGLSELPFFFFGKRLVEKYGSKNVFLFAMAGTAIRMFAYGLNSSPAVAVGIGAMHGISIGLFFVSVISFVHKIIPAEMRSTGQSLFYTFYAVGVAFGNLLTGVLYDYFPMRTVMTLNASAIVLLVLMVFVTKKYFSSVLKRSE
ncbi:MAG: MFS transporter [Prolixibacteraceae bacterium]